MAEEPDIQVKWRDYQKSTDRVRRQWAKNIAICQGFTEPNAVRRLSGNVNIEALKRPRFKVEFNDNLFLNIVTDHAGLLLGSEPEFVCRAPSTDDSKEDAAFAGQALIEDMLRRNHFGEIHEDLIYFLLTPGAVALQTYFDSTSIVPVKTNGGIVPSPEGEVKIEVIPPWRVAFDLTARRYKDCRWVIKESMLNPEEVLDRWGIEVEAQVILPDPSDIIAAMDSDEPWRREGVRVLEYFEKPCSKYPKGRYGVLANDVMVPLNGEKDGWLNLPYFDATGGAVQIPIFWGRELPTATRPHGQSLREHIIPHMRANDYIMSRRIENYAMIAGPKVLLDPVNTKKQKFTPEAFQVITVNGNGFVPRYMTPPEMPQDTIYLQQALTQGASRLAGNTDISEIAKSGVRSRGGQLTQVQRAGRKATFAGRAIEQILQEALSAALCLIQAYYSKERQVTVVGEDDEMTVRALSSSNVAGVDVIVVKGSAAPFDQESQLQRMEGFLQYGAKTGLIRPSDMEAYREYIMSSQVFRGIERSVHWKKARQENREMSKGATVYLCSFDDDKEHLQAHIQAFLRGIMRGEAKKKLINRHMHVIAHLKKVSDAVKEKTAMPGQPEMGDPNEPMFIDPLTGMENPAWRAWKESDLVQPSVIGEIFDPGQGDVAPSQELQEPNVEPPAEIQTSQEGEPIPLTE